MPLAELNVTAGRTAEQKARLLEAVRQAVLEGFQVGPGALSVWLREFPRENVLCPEGDGDFMAVRVTCFAGRDGAVKRRLFSVLAKRLAAIGEDPDRCVMTVADSPLENWGIHGGQSAADVFAARPADEQKMIRI